jgi:hypothetical protein
MAMDRVLHTLLMTLTMVALVGQVIDCLDDLDQVKPDTLICVLGCGNGYELIELVRTCMHTSVMI